MQTLIRSCRVFTIVQCKSVLSQILLDQHCDIYIFQVPVCPDCRMVDCYPELSQEDCPEGTILKEGLAFGGCCPACVTYMGEGERHTGDLGAQ